MKLSERGSGYESDSRTSNDDGKPDDSISNELKQLSLQQQYQCQGGTKSSWSEEED